MSEIPEDILAEAEKALDNLLCSCREAGDVRADSIRDIAKAILAERERCAQIASEYAMALRKNYVHSCARAVEGVLAAINTPSTPERRP